MTRINTDKKQRERGKQRLLDSDAPLARMAHAGIFVAEFASIPFRASRNSGAFRYGAPSGLSVFSSFGC
jgi:hypothetical protein